MRFSDNVNSVSTTSVYVLMLVLSIDIYLDSGDTRQRSRSKSKPMSEEDYRKVETELQRQLHSERFHFHQEVATPTDLHDVMTHSFG